MEQKKLTERKQISFFFLLCFLAYFSTYLGRLNYGASLAEMIRAERISKGQAGLIGTCFFCAYGLGQLVSGFLGERWNCKWLVFGGLAVSGVMNGVMGLLGEPRIMTVVWCINGIAQAMIWSPMLHMICELLETEVRLRFCTYINYSVPLGTVCSYGLSALCIGISGWRAAFLIPAVLVCAMAVFWVVGSNRLGFRFESRRNHVEEGKPLAGKTKHLFFSSGLIFLVVALCVQGALKDGVTTWIPTYLEENYAMGSIAAILSTMVIPLCNLIGVAFASLMEKWVGKNEVLAAAVFYGICGIALLVLWFLSGRSAAVAIVMLAVATSAMMSVNALLISVLPSRFGSLGKASSISGIMNSCVYAGCAASTYGIGAVSERAGWSFTILLWIACALCACGICLGICKRWGRYVEKEL